MTLTGVNADHRLRVPPSAVLPVAAALAAEVIPQGGGELAAALAALGKPAGVDAKWISECAKDLLAHAGNCVVVAGQRQPLAVHVLAHAMNAALGNLGKTVVFHEAPVPQEGSIGELARALNAGEVETLVILGGNPVYNAPAELDWAATQRKAKLVVRLGYYEDETYAVSDWSIPQLHYLESWGDARTSDGSLVPIQPLIAPLFEGMTELELLARLAGLEPNGGYEIVRETFRTVTGGGEEDWKRFLFNGFQEGSAAKPVEVALAVGGGERRVAGGEAGGADGQPGSGVPCAITAWTMAATTTTAGCRNCPSRSRRWPGRTSSCSVRRPSRSWGW